MLYSTVLAALVVLPGTSAQLNKLAKAAGKLYFGSATDNGELTDTSYVTILQDADEFGQIVSGLLRDFQVRDRERERERRCWWRTVCFYDTAMQMNAIN